VLDRVDLTVAAGSTVAIVGPSGQGKSTLAAALVRFIDPSAGTISVTGDGHSVDTRTVVGDELRRHIGWCTQDAHVFDSTLRANLSLADPGSDDAALAHAVNGARLDEFVASLPAGLDTMVGEHGRALSGGERQRLGLARLLLADPRIVVFDEPTEHLHDDTARAVMHDLLDATAGRTVIVITHRTDLLRGVDRVVELRDGRLVDGPRPGHAGAKLARSARADSGVPTA
jgi:ATP-binding cassette subfamily C protein CydCD